MTKVTVLTEDGVKRLIVYGDGGDVVVSYLGLPAFRLPRAEWDRIVREMAEEPESVFGEWHPGDAAKCIQPDSPYCGPLNRCSIYKVHGLKITGTGPVMLCIDFDDGGRREIPAYRFTRVAPTPAKPIPHAWQPGDVARAVISVPEKLTSGRIYVIRSVGEEFLHVLGDSGESDGWLPCRFEYVPVGPAAVMRGIEAAEKFTDAAIANRRDNPPKVFSGLNGPLPSPTLADAIVTVDKLADLYASMAHGRWREDAAALRKVLAEVQREPLRILDVAGERATISRVRRWLQLESVVAGMPSTESLQPLRDLQHECVGEAVRYPRTAAAFALLALYDRIAAVPR